MKEIQARKREQDMIEHALIDVRLELKKAMKKFNQFNSLHEGYAILLEEVDELWTHVKMNQKKRDRFEIRKECIQIAAMAIRIIIDCCYLQKCKK